MEIIFFILYMVVLLLSGLSIWKVYKNGKLINYISIGFVLHLAIIELLCWWMVAFHFPMKVFVASSALVVSVLSLVGIRNLIKNKDNLLSKPAGMKWYHLVLAIILIYECLQLVLFYRSDADDSFYVSNVLLFSKSESLNLYDSSFGNNNLGTVPMYDFQIWESYLAFLCRLCLIKPTVLCHYVMPIVLLIIAISAELCLGEELFEDGHRKYIFVCVLQIFYVWGGYAVYSKGSFLLSRLWQGKAVYLHVVLPLVLAVILRYSYKPEKSDGGPLNKKSSMELGTLLLLLMLSGIALNPTSMYVVGFQMLFMIVVVVICKREWKYVLCSLPAAFTIAFYSLMIFLRTKGNGGQMEAASAIPDDFLVTTLLSFFGDGKGYLLLYIACVVLILYKGNSKAKILCVYTPFVLLIGVWNPIMAPILAKHLTMVPSFWRVFWLIPVDFALAYSIGLLAEKKKIYSLAGIVLFFCIIFSGRYMFTSENNFVRAENKERITADVLEFGKSISESKDKTVLCCDYAATTLRQEYSDIELIVSRYQYILDLFMYRGKEDEAEDRIALCNFVNGNRNVENAGDLLNKYGVNWIVINSDYVAGKEYLSSIGYDVIAESDDRVLLKK